MQRLSRYALLTGGTTLAVWFLTRWVVALAVNTGGRRSAPMNFEPLANGLGVHLAGLALGVLVGIGIAWFYANYVEDP